MSAKNLLYAQSGGVTAVLNATACGVIETARKTNHFANVLCAKNGIIGVINEELIDISYETSEEIAALKHTPAAAFGSCRYKLKPFENNHLEYEHIANIMRVHNVGAFLYNGGGDSQDTTMKLATIFKKFDLDIKCIGIPKTIDNDLAITDNSPGFGSVAKYVATTIQEASLDVASMAASSTKVFIMEVMGRHSGWIAASAGLARRSLEVGPHLILFPEKAFVLDEFLSRVKNCVQKYNFCSIVVSEGIKDETGEFLINSTLKDAFGHIQLGGIAPLIAHLVKHNLGYKYHWAVLDYLQRSARHLASAVDVEQAYNLGEAATHMAIAGKNAVMPVIVRDSDTPYRWHIAEADIMQVANVEKKLPDDFISPDGYSITQKAIDYLLPLIQGEAYPPYQNGLPVHAQLKMQLTAKRYNKKWEN